MMSFDCDPLLVCYPCSTGGAPGQDPRVTRRVTPLGLNAGGFIQGEVDFQNTIVSAPLWVSSHPVPLTALLIVSPSCCPAIPSCSMPRPVSNPPQSRVRRTSWLSFSVRPRCGLFASISIDPDPATSFTAVPHTSVPHTSAFPHTQLLFRSALSTLRASPVACATTPTTSSWR